MTGGPPNRLGAFARWLKGPHRLSPTGVLLLLTSVGFLAAIVSGLLAYSANPERADDLWFEVTKSAVQVIAIGAIGGALTYAWERLAIDRDAEKQRRDKLQAELDDLVRRYNDVKSVRRVLRSLGLQEAAGYFTEQQVEGFREQMLALNDIQLDVEAKMRQFGQARLLRQGGELVVRDLHVIEQHLADVLEAAWEKLGPQVRAGAEIEPVSLALNGLFDSDLFRAHVSAPRRRITATINVDIFGKATGLARVELANIDNVAANPSSPGSP